MKSILAALALTIFASSSLAQEALDKAVAAAWPNVAPDLQGRLAQDEAMKICSSSKNNPTADQAKAITAAALASLSFPADNAYMGDWKAGEKLALDGYGLRMGDDPKRPNGGNCYACHQLAPKEISYGTLGPSLTGYGKLRDYKPEAQKELYAKIYNPQATMACSNMPRFGHNKVLNEQQMKDIVAFLMSPESPVNK